MNISASEILATFTYLRRRHVDKLQPMQLANRLDVPVQDIKAIERKALPSCSNSLLAILEYNGLRSEPLMLPLITQMEEKLAA